MLAHPDPARQYIVTTDASGFAVSGVLSQDQPDGSRRPVAFMSNKMNPAERLYLKRGTMMTEMRVRKKQLYHEEDKEKAKSNQRQKTETTEKTNT